MSKRVSVTTKDSTGKATFLEAKKQRKKHEPKFKKQEKKHCDICHGEGYDCHPNPCCKSLGLKHSPIEYGRK